MIKVSQRQSFSIRIENSIVNVRINEDELLSEVWNTANHSNAEYELHVITEGSCTAHVSGETLYLSTRDILLIAPNTYHSCQSALRKCRHFSISFIVKSGNLGSELSRTFRGFTSWNDGSSIIRPCNDYLSECASTNMYSYEMKLSFVSQILLHTLRKLCINDIAAPTQNNCPENHIDIMDQFFEQYYSEPAGESKLADELGISTRQLVRELRRFYGMTYRELIIKARLEQAKSLLRDTNIPIGTICKQLGYSTEASFYNMFKGQTGLSPQQFRNNAI